MKKKLKLISALEKCERDVSKIVEGEKDISQKERDILDGIKKDIKNIIIKSGGLV